MPSKESESTSPDINDQDKWQIDQVIMEYWDAKTEKDKKHLELECYKHFKRLGFNSNFIVYLEENGCQGLASEMRHFAQVYSKVPHEHEKRLAA